MAEEQEPLVIVDNKGEEHEFPAGFNKDVAIKILRDKIYGYDKSSISARKPQSVYERQQDEKRTVEAMRTGQPAKKDPSVVEDIANDPRTGAALVAAGGPLKGLLGAATRTGLTAAARGMRTPPEGSTRGMEALKGAGETAGLEAGFGALGGMAKYGGGGLSRLGRLLRGNPEGAEGPAHFRSAVPGAPSVVGSPNAGPVGSEAEAASARLGVPTRGAGEPIQSGRPAIDPHTGEPLPMGTQGPVDPKTGLPLVDIIRTANPPAATTAADRISQLFGLGPARAAADVGYQQVPAPVREPIDMMAALSAIRRLLHPLGEPTSTGPSAGVSGSSYGGK